MIYYVFICMLSADYIPYIHYCGTLLYLPTSVCTYVPRYVCMYGESVWSISHRSHPPGAQQPCKAGALQSLAALLADVRQHNTPVNYIHSIFSIHVPLSVSIPHLRSLALPTCSKGPPCRNGPAARNLTTVVVTVQYSSNCVVYTI